ncbi:MAG: hypothetical protein PHR06_10840 [Candidatus Cloacimonetes bacterium]|nr:hypothetical protein [Candidatus Cloacimonadota bacterium]
MKKNILTMIMSSLVIVCWAFGQNKVHVDQIEWSKIKTIHFDIYFIKGEEEFGQKLVLMAEEAYYYLQSKFNIPLRDKIPLIVYHTHLDFQKTNIIDPLLNEAVGGFTESLKNRVVVPFNGSYLELEEVLIHELTHAYINGITYESASSRILGLTGGRFPFWFSEGLPEFNSIGGTNVYNEMIMMDMVINGYMPQMENLDGYFAYRMGESFLKYIADEYGEDKVMKLFYSIRIASNQDNAFKKNFGLTFEEIQSRWKTHLRKKYADKVKEYDVPNEVFSQLTNTQKDDSYYNFTPRISPDGRNYIFFSNKRLRSSIWYSSIHKTSSPKRMVTGELVGKYEDFHFRRNGMAWFPDGKTFAFVARSVDKDIIYYRDTEKNKNIGSLLLPDFAAIYELDISRDGKKMVFSAQKGVKNDLFIYEFETEVLTRITDDRYLDYQPRWSADGNKIFFTSERTFSDQEIRPFVFSRLRKNIFSYDLNSQKFCQITFDEYDNYNPIPDSTGTKLYFLTERTGVSNFDVINLSTNERGEVTRVLSGITGGDLSVNDEYLIMSCYYNNGWDIYLKYNPLEKTEFSFYRKPEEVTFTDDFREVFNLDRYQLYGEREAKDDKKRIRKESRIRVNQEDKLAFADSIMARSKNRKLDEKPTAPESIPVINDYKPEFHLDYVWGGVAYASSVGMIGELHLSFSDLMGNHGINVSAGLAGNILDSDFSFSYLYLKNRIDYGFGIFKTTDETIYKIIPVSEPSKYYYQRNREYYYGAQFLTRYPFNRFWRLEFFNYLYYYEEKIDFARRNSVGDWSDWTESVYYPKHSSYMYQPMVSLVHDNALYGSTGPISGWRGSASYLEGISSKNRDFRTFYLDLRGYQYFAKRYCLAARVIGGASFGDRPQQFDLEGFNGVRGYVSDDEKNAVEEAPKKFLGSLELRYPFLDYFKMGFPLPLAIQNIRGSMFVDVGSIWDESYRGIRDGTLEDLKMGFGFGPRLNIGYFVLRLDITWSTDFMETSSPSYYLSLWPDF